MRHSARLTPVLLLLVGTAIAGCASRRDQPARAEPRSADGYLSRPAAALAWSPPAAGEIDPAEFDAILARDGRGQAAFLGYDLPTIQTLDVVVDDRQDRRWWGFTSGWADRYDRRAMSTRSTVRYR